MKLDRKGSFSHLLSQLDGLNRLCGLCVLHSAQLSDGDNNTHTSGLLRGFSRAFSTQ